MLCYLSQAYESLPREPMDIAAWIDLMGFFRHPFNPSDAEREIEISDYAVLHHLCEQVVSVEKEAQSSIFIGKVGSGKTFLRRIFEETYGHLSLSFLIVSMKEWDKLTELRYDPGFTNGSILFAEIAYNFALTISEKQKNSVLNLTQNQIESAEYLHFIAKKHEKRLGIHRKRALESIYQHLNFNQNISVYNLFDLDFVDQAHILAQISSDLGYNRCYILIDGVENVKDRLSPADILGPLLRQHSVHHSLYIKYFLTPEAKNLLSQYGWWQENLLCEDIVWSDDMLMDLLYKRLSFFSQGFHIRVSNLCDFGINDIDKKLVIACEGSPRKLINLVNKLFATCAAEAKPHDFRIKMLHIDAILSDNMKAIAQVSSIKPEPDNLSIGGSMDSSDKIRNLQERLEIHYRTLEHLLKQQALFTEAYVPPVVIHGINEARKNIASIKAELSKLGIPVEDRLDDIDKEGVEKSQIKLPPAIPSGAIFPLEELEGLSTLIQTILTSGNHSTINDLLGALPIQQRGLIRQTGVLRNDIIGMLDQLNSRVWAGEHPLYPLLKRVKQLAEPYGRQDDVESYVCVLHMRLNTP